MRDLVVLPEDFLTCRLCGQTFTHRQWLSRHLKKDHETDLYQYVLEQFLGGKEPKCQCGHCNETVLFYIKDGKVQAPEYAHGHNFRNPETRALSVTEEAKQKQRSSREKTLRERYGIKNTFELSDTKLVSQKSHSEEANQKRKQTLLERYGVDQNFKRPEVIASHTTEEANRLRQEHTEQTVLEKYGVRTTFQLPEVQEKASSAKALEKKRRTNLEKFGYEYPYLDPEVRDKFHKVSKGEQEVVEFLESLGIRVERLKRKYLGTAELDIYLPDYKIGIEYDGLYWHSEELGKEPGYHLNKTLKAEQEGIHLVHIFEDEWKHKQEIVKDRLKAMLGLTGTKLYARNCSIKQITGPEAEQFLETNHVQGSCKSSVKYGVFYNEELVACCTFGKPRSGLKSKGESGWELLRFCTKQEFGIVGILPKILKQFHKDYPEVLSVYSFADRRYTTKLHNIYLRTGFTYESESQPSYWYFKSGKLIREHRTMYMKHILVEKNWGKEDQTESEIMRQQGYFRIWDCGTLKYRFFF